MSWLRRRRSEDETAAETGTGTTPARPWSRYADSFSMVIRETDWRGEEPYSRALAADFVEIGVDLPLEELVPEVEGWLARERGDNFQVEIRRTYVSAGASGVGAQLLITFLGTTGGTVASLAIYDALRAFVKERVAPGSRGGGARIAYLRSLDEADAESYLAGRVARAIDRRRSDLVLVEFVLDENEARAVYDVGDDRYVARVEETAYRITRIESVNEAERPREGAA